MNLWLRLFWLLVTARSRAPIAPPTDPSSLKFRVWPQDLDLSLHMNNGRYLTIMDLGRLDIIVRTGLWRAVMRNGWTPVANAVVIRFRRELRHLDRYRLETRILAWSDVTVVMEQVFLFAGGEREGQIAARALMKGGLYDRKRRAYVPVDRLMAEIDFTTPSPPLTPEIDAFLKAEDELKRTGA